MNMLSFSVCPHDTEKGEIDKWKSLVCWLSEQLGQEVSFIPLSDFSEEKRRIWEGNFFDLYYANPFSAVELALKGYRPLAKLKGQRDRYFIFYSELPEEGQIRVATALLRPLGLLLLQMDIDRVEILVCEGWQRVVEMVESGLAHAGIIYEEVWQQLDEKRREKFKLLDRFIFESSHIFMVRREYEKSLKAILDDDRFEPAEHILQNLIKAYEDYDNLYKFWTRVKAFKLMEKLSGVGLILYCEKGITLINDYALKVLEYSKEELVNKSLVDFINTVVHASHRDLVFEVISKRLRGEQFDYNYAELAFVSKRGRKIHTYSSSVTVPYGDNTYGGLVIFIDITSRKRLESIYKTLRDINLAITTSLFEEELFDRIGKSLLEKLEFKLMVVFKIEKGRKPELYRVYNGGQHLSEDKLKPLDFQEEIFIQPDTRDSKEFGWLSGLGVASFCSIKLRAPEDRLYVLNLYSPELFFFEEENKDILYELKHDIEFALLRLYDWRKAFIVKGALDRSSTWLVVTDKDGIITYVNDAVCRITGYERKELLGKKTSIFKSGFHNKSFYEELWRTISAGKEFYAVFVNRKKNGETFYVEQHIYPIELPGGIGRYVSIGMDITRELELSEEIRRLSRTDPVTGFLNREGFENLVEEELKQSSDKSYAFVLIDLYGTGSINQRFGTASGDIYLQSFASLLEQEFRETRLIGRLYGDKFAVLLPIKSDRDALVIEERLLRIMDNHVDLGEHIPVSLNAGVSLFPTNGRSFSELYSKAKLALEKAKSLGEGRIVMAEPDIQQRSADFIFAMKLVKNAIEKELFLLYFQPYFDVDTLRLRGFEALTRIVDEDGKVYTPGYFIDYLERSRYLQSFEGWLLREAVSSAQELSLSISINLSAATLRDTTFMKTFLSIPDLPIVIEITERTIVELDAKALELLMILRKEKGIKIAMDDFGTGYSTLSQIAQLPIDILKIDMSFVRNMIENKKTRAIVRNTIALARDLGIRTLAEGIETEAQLRMLQGMDCDMVQGFLLGKPMPLQNAIDFLRQSGSPLKVG